MYGPGRPCGLVYVQLHFILVDKIVEPGFVKRLEKRQPAVVYVMDTDSRRRNRQRFQHLLQAFAAVAFQAQHQPVGRFSTK